MNAGCRDRGDDAASVKVEDEQLVRVHMGDVEPVGSGVDAGVVEPHTRPRQSNPGDLLQRYPSSDSHTRQDRGQTKKTAQGKPGTSCPGRDHTSSTTPGRNETGSIDPGA